MHMDPEPTLGGGWLEAISTKDGSTLCRGESLSRWPDDIVLSKDREQVFIAYDAELIVCDSKTLGVVNRIKTGTRVSHVTASPDGTKVAAAGPGWKVLAWQLPSLAKLPFEGPHKSYVFDVAFVGADELASCGKDGVRLWRLDGTGELLTSGDRAWDSAVSPDSRLLAVAQGELRRGAPGTVSVWDLQSRERIAELRLDQCTTGVAWIDDSRLAVECQEDVVILSLDLPPRAKRR
jgi:WD40 repeat protein